MFLFITETDTIQSFSICVLCMFCSKLITHNLAFRSEILIKK